MTLALHCGTCDSASRSLYVLFQDLPKNMATANVKAEITNGDPTMLSRSFGRDLCQSDRSANAERLQHALQIGGLSGILPGK